MRGGVCVCVKGGGGEDLPRSHDSEFKYFCQYGQLTNDNFFYRGCLYFSCSRSILRAINAQMKQKMREEIAVSLISSSFSLVLVFCFDFSSPLSLASHTYTIRTTPPSSQRTNLVQFQQNVQ